MFYGLREAVDMLLEEGMENVFARHAGWPATRAAVEAWGFENQSINAARSIQTLLRPSACLMASMPMRSVGSVLKNFDMSLAAGLGKVAGVVFRIGHLGYQNDLTLMGALSGVEMSLDTRGNTP